MSDQEILTRAKQLPDGETEVGRVTAIKQIKQGLQEAGYAQVDKRKYRDELGREYIQYTITYADGSGEYARVPQFDLMTPQEWYDRFKKELKGKIFPNHCTEDIVNVAGTLEECRAAARKASGLEG